MKRQEGIIRNDLKWVGLYRDLPDKYYLEASHSNIGNNNGNNDVDDNDIRWTKGLLIILG